MLKARSVSDLTHAFLALLPTGAVWPRHPVSTLVRTVRALMGVVARFLDRAATFLIIEAFPPSASHLLPDWERVLGLPEPCLPVTDLTIAERRLQVREKLRRRPGGQSRVYFLKIAERLGYPGITITEHIPAQCGLTPCGAMVSRTGTPNWTAYPEGPFSRDFSSDFDGGVDLPFAIRGAGCGTPSIRYLWVVRVPGARLTWFAAGAGGGRCGMDPHLKIRRADDLECLLHKLKPEHTRLIFAYQGA